MESLLSRIGLSELAGKLGNSTLTGIAVGGGVALVAALAGTMESKPEGTKSGGWWKWLLVPVAAIIGGLAGDFIGKDGPVFGRSGLAKKLTSRTVIPKGYVAENVNASTYAVDSATIMESGETICSNTLDKSRIIELKGDKRLEELAKKAEGYKAQFARIKDVRERERKIIELIGEDVGKKYGETLN